MPAKPDVSGIIAIANAIPDMGALVSLNLGNNAVGPVGATAVFRALANQE
jgi:hypothetical protein